MYLSRRKVLNGYIFICIILIILISMFKTLSFSSVNISVIFTFALNGIMIFIRLLKNFKLGYSLNNIISMFMFVFMFLAPVVQYTNQVFPWGDTYLITDEKVIITNFLIFVFFTIYFITYDIFIGKYNKRINREKVLAFINTKLILNIGFVIAVMSAMYIIYITGFNNLFARSTNNTGLESVQSLIVNNFLKGFPMTVLLLHIVYWKNNKKTFDILQLIILIISTILINFPTGNPRFQVAVVYLALLISIKQKFKNKYLFQYIFFIGLFLVFPLINIFRNNTFNDLKALNISLSNPLDDFLTGNFDAYSMLTRSIIYVEDFGSTFGRQLLGSILFFVPRNIWPTKPIGSGAFLGEEYFGWNFTNVSMPYIGEGYINFGVIGVVLFSILLSFSTSKLDYKYEQITLEPSSNEIQVISVVYPLLIGFVFFIMRGDLLSTLSFTIGNGIMPIFSLLVIDRLFKLIKTI